MGHHSIKVTVDTYGHLVPGGNQAAVDRLDEPSAASIRNPDATSTARLSWKCANRVESRVEPRGVEPPTS
jgi:hypothetical protein